MSRHQKAPGSPFYFFTDEELEAEAEAEAKRLKGPGYEDDDEAPGCLDLFSLCALAFLALGVLLVGRGMLWM